MEGVDEPIPEQVANILIQVLALITEEAPVEDSGEFPVQEVILTIGQPPEDSVFFDPSFEADEQGDMELPAIVSTCDQVFRNKLPNPAILVRYRFIERLGRRYVEIIYSTPNKRFIGIGIVDGEECKITTLNELGLVSGDLIH